MRAPPSPAEIDAALERIEQKMRDMRDGKISVPDALMQIHEIIEDVMRLGEKA